MKKIICLFLMLLMVTGIVGAVSFTSTTEENGCVTSKEGYSSVASDARAVNSEIQNLNWNKFAFTEYSGDISGEDVELLDIFLWYDNDVVNFDSVVFKPIKDALNSDPEDYFYKFDKVSDRTVDVSLGTPTVEFVDNMYVRYTYKDAVDYSFKVKVSANHEDINLKYTFKNGDIVLTFKPYSSNQESMFDVSIDPEDIPENYILFDSINIRAQTISDVETDARFETTSQVMKVYADLSEFDKVSSVEYKIDDVAVALYTVDDFSTNFRTGYNDIQAALGDVALEAVTEEVVTSASALYSFDSKAVTSEGVSITYCTEGVSCGTDFCRDIASEACSADEECVACVDTDGAETTTKETTTGVWWVDLSVVEKTDACEGGKVKEYYCDSSNQVKYALYSCASGSICTNGACAKVSAVDAVPSAVPSAVPPKAAVSNAAVPSAVPRAGELEEQGFWARLWAWFTRRSTE